MPITDFLERNAKIYPNILCFAPMCSIDLLNRDSGIPQIMNDSYYKLVVEKILSIA